ncbi:MAG: flagellar basal-body rod protein FlgG [Myxococcota bacterium]
MSRALFTAATGMLAQERKIDVIANNLANVNTDGFKGSRAEFQDLMYQTLRAAGAGGSALRSTATGTQVGLGVKDGAIVRDFSQGAFKNTGKSTDVAISGSGFFVVRLDDGSYRLTRNGAFRVSAQGELVTKDGHPLWPIVQVPLERAGLAIGADGSVEAILPQGERRLLGALQVAEVRNVDALEATGDNLFSIADFDLNVTLTQPGQNGTGRLEAGFLEGSNVKVVEEMIAMITGQRAYEANSRVIQTADRMMEETNRLR